MKSAELTLQAVEFLLILFVRQRFAEINFIKKRHRLQRKCILQDRNGQRMILDGCVNAQIQELKDLKFCPFLVLGIDDIPRNI